MWKNALLKVESNYVQLAAQKDIIVLVHILWQYENSNVKSSLQDFLDELMQNTNKELQYYNAACVVVCFLAIKIFLLNVTEKRPNIYKH